MKSLLLLLIVWVQFLLSCGSNSTSYADSRKWASDSTPNDNFTLTDPGIAAFNSTSVEDTGYTGFGSLYQSARFFNTSATYSFTVDPEITVSDFISTLFSLVFTTQMIQHLM
jgi:hypothetical protein